MNVKITSIGVLSAQTGGPIEHFNPRSALPVRKHIKLMARGVQLGVAALRIAVEDAPNWESTSPQRRGIFVGSTPVGSGTNDLIPALQACQQEGRFLSDLFGEKGLPLVPPLWLVKGLSNNVLGYCSGYFDAQGVNGNRCEGRTGGVSALLDAARAIDEGRVDIAVAGGADSLIEAAEWLHTPVGEGAAFFILEREGPPRSATITDGGLSFSPNSGTPSTGPLGELGAASGVVQLARRLNATERSFDIRVHDYSGTHAWIRIE